MGNVEPSLAELDAIATKLHVPIGYLFLDEPPQENTPIPDFRTLNSRDIRSPSPNMLDMIYLSQERQNWYREFALSNNFEKLQFVASKTIQDKPLEVAHDIRQTIEYSSQDRKDLSRSEDLLRLLIKKAESVGFLIMISGVFASSTSRKLNLEEFRGFALSDEYAPLIFLNGNDAKAGQLFTFAHELAHIWLGSTGVSNIKMDNKESVSSTEIWCNAVATEFLVPLKELKSAYIANENVRDTVSRLVKTFKVSGLVALRRMQDIGWITDKTFLEQWNVEVEAYKSILENNKSKSKGADFYNTLFSRTGKRFASAVIESALEGKTLYRDALHMLGTKNIKVLKTAADKIEAFR